MVRHARVLVLVAAACLALGAANGLAAPREGAASLSALAAARGAAGPVLHVRTTGRLETVAYTPQPGVWLIEMPEEALAEPLVPVTAPDLGIERAEVAQVEEFGKRLTRLSVWLARPMAMELEERQDGFDLVFSDPSAPAVIPASEPASTPEASPAPPSAEEAVHAVEVEPVETAEAPAHERSASGANLLAVEPVAGADGVTIRLEGDGAFAPHAFRLSGPERLVVDLPGVVCRAERRVLPVHAAGVRRVRVAQFRAVPEPVTRLVVDLEEPAAYDVDATPGGAVVVVGGGAPEALAAARTSPAEPRQEYGAVKTANGGSVTVESLPSGTIEISRSHPAGSAPAEHPGPEPSAESAPVAIPAHAPATAPAAASAPASSDPFTADASQLVERAAAAQELDLPSAGQYETKEVQTEEKQYTGEPISLRLKDADIKDVLRTFSELTGLNIVVDPGVSGSVTVELHDVPWDQALDLILKINGLDYVLENNVLRVAPISKLAAEKAAQANLAKQQEMTKPLKTVIKPLSYANASQAAGIIKKDGFLLSERGSIIVDNGTNTLIIRDTVDRVEGILKLLAQLDQPVPQVMIEARIVETTRNFSHKLGVNWGFSGVMDAAHGNDTGLDFPNSVSVGGGVNLGLQYPAGVRSSNGTIGFSFGDILNTFNLDFMLQAAENDGLVRIVSSPRVVAQNMQKATIRSGLQLPVQTVANNTVTVQYVDATLRLDVTPQITAEGTVMLDLDVKKQEPVTALLVQGAQNAPISTRDAKTKVLVRDGGTTVIGGIYQVNDQTTKNSVPGLSKIPILGRLFRSTEVNNRHDERLIFITPRIAKY